MRSSKTKFKRVQPLLGTFVEIEFSAPDARTFHRNAAHAFEAIKRIDRLMSFHRADSDLSKINSAEAHEWIFVDAHTRRVLAAANKLHVMSKGVFDVRRAPMDPSGTVFPPVVISGSRVCKTGPWILDLGGIAKGYAVDQAVKTLKRLGVTAGLVNAGGDLRVFGADEWPIALRHPSAPSVAVPVFPLKNGSLATSAAYFSRKRPGGRWTSALVSARDGRFFLRRSSVSVLSATCMMADALTKVAALSPRGARASLLRRFHSHAFEMGRDGRVRSAS
jgi:thiamine biosynthesis lipoprotein